MTTADALGFWGKAQPEPEAACGFHPVVYHLLDVAATADVLLGARPLALARGARLLGLDPDAARRLMVALIVLHDIGKFAPKFQAKAAPAGWEWPSVLGRYDPGRLLGTHHTTDGYALWCDGLRDRVGPMLWRGGDQVLEALAPGLFGHHGRPVRSADGFFARATHGLGPATEAVASACARTLLCLLQHEPLDAAPPDLDSARIASWWVAGLVTVADWIGSNQQWFPYTAPDAADGDCSRYWAYARARAQRAIAEAGTVSPPSARPLSMRALTGIDQPSPAQEWAASVALPDGPVLVVLEDVTGSGKTEAAQMLVHRLMSAGRATGGYWAMPTQATANAMYNRQAEAIAALYDTSDGLRPSLALAHGKSRFHERFRMSVLGSAARGPEADSVGPTCDPELLAGAECAAFLADDRRAAFLADVGAGSIDQALLGVLPSRFNVVRLFGLADKVLVVDEAHAYDAYMRVELQELLRFHAALGGCAVVLSATLSQRGREQLVTAWMEGIHRGRRRLRTLAAEPVIRESAYPLATVVAPGDVTAREGPLRPASWSARRVPVRFVHTESDVVDHLIAAREHGAAVAWIRNTVDDCLAAASALRARGVDPLVFHARFADADRQAREGDVLARFGKAPTAPRAGQIVVATQVIEQSLDLDFDVMVTDLAPVDLLIQRAGRLWRHPIRNGERPGGSEPELVVLAPLFDPEPSADWLTALLPGTAYVYANTAVLWRTVRALEQTPELVTPDGLRMLVEAVYASDDVPDALIPATDRAHGAEQANAAAGNQATLKVADGYNGNAQGWVDDLRAPTRLGVPQTVVRLARVTQGGALRPWAEGESVPSKAWALSEIRLSARRIPGHATAEPMYNAAIEALRAGWNRFDREVPVLPLLNAESNCWEGALVTSKGDRVAVRYEARNGLAFVGRV